MNAGKKHMLLGAIYIESAVRQVQGYRRNRIDLTSFSLHIYNIFLH